jgi:uncharacterized repeat protein (TIGR01451 family)
MKTRVLVLSLFAVLALLLTWQLVFAQAPTPNPLPNVTGVDVTQVGQAASIHGSPLAGRAVFDKNCASCHGDRGAEGEDNPGSDDGVVPVVNPIDPGFLEHSQGDPSIFAADLDLFLQHGSRPNGDNPKDSMPAWGDTKKLSQQDIADVEAYVMSMNGVYWPGKWYPPAELQMDAVQSGKLVTYTVTILNHGGTMGDVLIRDTLPAGLALVSTDYYGNPAQVSGSTAQWLVGDIAAGAETGPFTIVAAVTGASAPANVSQIVFSACTWDGNCYPTSVVSGATVPGK